MNTNEISMMELKLDEMEQVNGGGLFEWIEENIALPVYKEIKNSTGDLLDNIDKLKKMAEEKTNEVLKNVTDYVKSF